MIPHDLHCNAAALTRLDHVTLPLRPQPPPPLRPHPPLQPGPAPPLSLGLRPLPLRLARVTRCCRVALPGVTSSCRRCRQQEQQARPGGLAHAAPEPLPGAAHLGHALGGVERVRGREGRAAALPLGAAAQPRVAPEVDGGLGSRHHH